MAFTEQESIRIQAIETMLNDVQTALNNVATKRQLNTLVVIRQQEIDELKQRVLDLETQVADLQSAL